MYKLIAYTFIFFLFSAACFGQAESVSVVDYAKEIKNIISSGNVDKFRDQSCYPSSCIDDDVINYIFGDYGKPGVIKLFLDKNSVRIKVFGPFTYSDDAPKQSYLILYYDSAKIEINKIDEMTSVDRKAMWGVGYVETVVIFIDGKWGFHYSPFYYGAHSPWDEDY